MIDFVHHIDRETSRFVELVSEADPTAPVATCGEWSVADLTWHLCEVQSFWGWIVAERAEGPDAYVEPTRPADDGDLPSALDGARHRLVEVLRASPPETPCWSWSDDQTIGFTRRRQAHEALVHRVDAELALTGSAGDVDAELAADGIDEVLNVFVGGVPSWATFSRSDETIQIVADADRQWTIALGRMTGTSPDSGRSYDLIAAEPVEAPSPTATISGSAPDLDLWLWGRASIDQLAVSGDGRLADELRVLVAEATQ